MTQSLTWTEVDIGFGWRSGGRGDRELVGRECWSYWRRGERSFKGICSIREREKRDVALFHVFGKVLRWA